MFLFHSRIKFTSRSASKSYPIPIADFNSAAFPTNKAPHPTALASQLLPPSPCFANLRTLLVIEQVFPKGLTTNFIYTSTRKRSYQQTCNVICNSQLFQSRKLRGSRQSLSLLHHDEMVKRGCVLAEAAVFFMKSFVRMQYL